jgi:hypothetical protein
MKTFFQGLCVVYLTFSVSVVQASPLEDSTRKAAPTALVAPPPAQLSKKQQLAAIQLRVEELKLINFGQLPPEQLQAAKEELRQLRQQYKTLNRSGFWPKRPLWPVWGFCSCSSSAFLCNQHAPFTRLRNGPA